MSGRIFLANVGANASHTFCSPIFPNKTFEFIPIPETQDLTGNHAIRYKDLISYYRNNVHLKRYVPPKLWDWPTHNDPEFVTFTYGDNCEISSRGASLKTMDIGDFLFFLARLQNWTNLQSTNMYGFYLIGFLEIEEILKNVRSLPDEYTLNRFNANSHIRRGLSDSKLWDRFWVFKGSCNSRRFQHAVPVTKNFAQRVFLSANGSPWKWDRGRSELQVIGSYTRSCRCVISPTDPRGDQRIKTLWEWVRQHS